MKPVLSASFYGLLVILSITLQGCDGPIDSMVKTVNGWIFGAPKQKPKTAKVTAETMATCNGGEFSCVGPDKEYCREQEKECRKANGVDDTCAPLCHWSCQEAKCEKACEPKCSAPVCQTRCKGFNTQSCHMKCQKPNCAVICPKTGCHNAGCVKCSTQCSAPTCHLECGKDLQNCHNVCAEPFCNWECKNPESCPKPKCEMKCHEPTQNCLTSKIHKELPPMKEGESQVINFEAAMLKGKDAAAAPAAAPPAGVTNGTKFLQLSTGQKKMWVKVATMGPNNVMESHEVQLPVSDDKVVVQPMGQVRVENGVKSVWTSKATTMSDGQVIRSSASCKGGNFQCHGEQDWCGEQESRVCEGRTSFARSKKYSAQTQLKA